MDGAWGQLGVGPKNWSWGVKKSMEIRAQGQSGVRILGKAQRPGLKIPLLGGGTRWEDKVPDLEPQTSVLHPAGSGHPRRGRQGWGVTQGVPLQEESGGGSWPSALEKTETPAQAASFSSDLPGSGRHESSEMGPFHSTPHPSCPDFSVQNTPVLFVPPVCPVLPGISSFHPINTSWVGTILQVRKPRLREVK